MSTDPFCPRQIIFEIPGTPGVLVTATENEATGAIDFTLDVEDGATTADLRALFFHFNETKLAGLQISGGDGLLTESRVRANSVLDLGDGATLAGAVKSGFDVGLEWGTAGGKKDDISFPVHFTLSSPAGALSLDDFAGLMFGAKLDSVGGPGGPRGGAAKLTTIAPWAPDAQDDNNTTLGPVYEDGAAGLNSPSKSPHGVVLNVLANDHDGDGDTLTVTGFHDGPSHGTVEILPDGNILYTPDLDYSGPESFEYCVSDGHGGQDHALVSFNIQAVADDPLISTTVVQGEHINEMVVTVTADQDDADSSEYITRIDVGTLPAGVTIAPLTAFPGGQPDHVEQQFLLTVPTGQDVDFDLSFTAVSRETSNGDEESATDTTPIEIDFTHNQTDLAFSTTDQSLWSSGPSDPFDFHDVIGLKNFSLDSNLTIPVSDIPPAWIDITTSGSLTFGFDTIIHLDAGNIDIDLTVTTTIDTTYNKTTDTLFFDPTYTLKSGTFTTTGPSGYTDIDFVFDLNLDVSATVEPLDTILDLVGLGGWANISGSVPDYEPRRIDVIPFGPGHLGTDSPDLPLTWPVLPGIVSVILDWPHLGIDSGGSLAATDSSNNFLTLNLDVEGAAISSFPLLAPIDPDIYNDDNFEWTDIDLFGGLNVIQDLLVTLQNMSGQLTLEDGGTPIDFAFGTPPAFITDVLSHDLDGDGKVDLAFAISPLATLDNDTKIGVNVGVDVEILKNLPIIGGTAVDPDPVDIPLADISIAGGTFDITGFGSQNWDIFV